MSSICLITALPAEARPLISHFGLRAIPHRYLRLYQGNFGYLLQCGVGKLDSAASTAAMLQTLPEVSAVINIGIAGSEHPVGQTLLAHSVQDQASSKQWFPHLPPVNQLPDTVSVHVLSVDQPRSNYTSDVAFDMEAAGVFSAASKVLDLAFIHCLKVVSDNAQSSIEAITAQSATDNVSKAIPSIERLMQALPFDALPTNAEVERLTRSLTQHIHYTITEQHALNQLLHRYNALFDRLPNEIALRTHGNAKTIRRALQTEIDAARVIY